MKKTILAIAIAIAATSSTAFANTVSDNTITIRAHSEQVRNLNSKVFELQQGQKHYAQAIGNNHMRIIALENSQPDMDKVNSQIVANHDLSSSNKSAITSMRREQDMINKSVLDNTLKIQSQNNVLNDRVASNRANTGIALGVAQKNRKLLGANTQAIIGEHKYNQDQQKEIISNQNALIREHDSNLIQQKSIDNNSNALKREHSINLSQTKAILDNGAKVDSLTEHTANIRDQANTTDAKVESLAKHTANVRDVANSNASLIKSVEKDVATNAKRSSELSAKVSDNSALVTSVKSEVANNANSSKVLSKGLAKANVNISANSTQMKKVSSVANSNAKALSAQGAHSSVVTDVVAENAFAVQSVNAKVDSLAEHTAAIRDQSNLNAKHIVDLRKDMERQFKEVNKKVDGSYAQAAALSSLMQPYNVGKFAVTSSVGHYGDANSLALGVGYRMNENVAMQVRSAWDDASEKASVGFGVLAEF